MNDLSDGMAIATLCRCWVSWRPNRRKSSISLHPPSECSSFLIFVSSLKREAESALPTLDPSSFSRRVLLLWG
ncbi:hypothetical protein NDA03_15880 [Trichocoleus sp. Lan]